MGSRDQKTRRGWTESRPHMCPWSKSHLKIKLQLLCTKSLQAKECEPMWPTTHTLGQKLWQQSRLGVFPMHARQGPLVPTRDRKVTNRFLFREHDLVFYTLSCGFTLRLCAVL